MRHTDTIYSALLADGADQAEIDAIMARLAPEPAEQPVPGWKARPPLRSKQTATLGAEDELITVRLPILGGDHYWTLLLPAVEEWAAGLYKGQALVKLQEAAANPIDFVLEMFRELVYRRQADALKVSFYEIAAFLLSGPDAEVTPEFFSVCPPNQQMAVVRQVVEINAENFRLWRDEMPLPLRRLIFSFQAASMESINALSETVLLTTRRMTMELQARLLTNGGLADTGFDASGALPEEKPTISPPSET